MVSVSLANQPLEAPAPPAPAAPAEPAAPPVAPPADPPMPRRDAILLVAYSIVFVVIPFLMVYLFHANPSSWTLAGDGRSLLLATLLGMGMGAVHSLASISTHAGKRDLGAAWRTYYVCRPFTGGGIALVTCLILLSGLGGFSVPAPAEGAKRELVLLAWAALAGLYSQAALDKLKDLFASLFATKEKDNSASGTSQSGAGAKSSAGAGG
jgi:hypothetical protein